MVDSKTDNDMAPEKGELPGRISHQKVLSTWLEDKDFKEEYNQMTSNDILQDWIQGLVSVLNMGAQKYGKDTWLKGEHFTLKDNLGSMSRHAAKGFTEDRSFDEESKLDHELHLATRALMQYTLKKQGILK